MQKEMETWSSLKQFWVFSSGVTTGWAEIIKNNLGSENVLEALIITPSRIQKKKKMNKNYLCEKRHVNM